MRVIAGIAVVCLFISQTSVAADDPIRSLLFSDGQGILQNSSRIIVYSLNPHLGPLFSFDREAPANFHGYAVLGSVELSGEMKSELLGKLYTALAEDASPARCFAPRHGIHAENDRGFVDLVICFECQQAESYMRSRHGGSTISRSAMASFDKVLRDANALFRPDDPCGAGHAVAAPPPHVAFEPPAGAEKLCGGHVTAAPKPDGSGAPHVVWTAYSSRESPDVLVKRYSQPFSDASHTKRGGCDIWQLPRDTPVKVFEICAVSETGPWTACSPVPGEARSIIVISSMAGR